MTNQAATQNNAKGLNDIAFDAMVLVLAGPFLATYKMVVWASKTSDYFKKYKVININKPVLGH